VIPNIIHFVFGLCEDFGGRPFSLVHYLAVKSAYDCNRPEVIYLHYAHQPSGEWWDRAKPYLTLIQLDPPKEIFGKPLLHYAHVSDIIRLEVLLKYGGIYLDIDVVCLKAFAPFFKHETVMGKEREGGLCNAVILAAPKARFIRRWYLDELPQLINVLKGDMAIVGPRAQVMGMRAVGVCYEDLVPNYRARHAVRPGITGLAQVRGYRGEIKDAEHAIARIDADLEYIHSASLWLDLKILALTGPSVAFGSIDC